MSVVDLARRLPEITTLRRWSMSLAVLDAIMSEAWECRYFSFDANWSVTEEMASMRNGSGDEYSIVFSEAGAYIRGFDHESPLSPWAQSSPQVVPGLLDDLPPSLRGNVTEPAFTLLDIPALTVCLWREPLDPRWNFGRPALSELTQEDGGAAWLFSELDGRAESYVAYAEDYFECRLRWAMSTRSSIISRLTKKSWLGSTTRRTSRRYSAKQT